ncbi:MAG: hypothetical protein ACFB5Z_17595 [Elainellaceae cyanobacterium]
MSNQYMKDKQKVTLYIPPELHRQLKIQSAVDSEAMSAIAERALTSYLESAEDCGHGHAYQIHSCPKCSADFVIRNGEVRAIASQPSSPDAVSSQVIEDQVIKEAGDAAESAEDDNYLPNQARDPEELVPC